MRSTIEASSTVNSSIRNVYSAHNLVLIWCSGIVCHQMPECQNARAILSGGIGAPFSISANLSIAHSQYELVFLYMLCIYSSIYSSQYQCIYKSISKYVYVCFCLFKDRGQNRGIVPCFAGSSI